MLVPVTDDNFVVLYASMDVVVCRTLPVRKVYFTINITVVISRTIEVGARRLNHVRYRVEIAMVFY